MEIALACLLLSIYLVYKELKRKNRAFLVWRILASVTLSAALAAMVLPISYTVKQQSRLAELHLVTAGKADLPAKTSLFTLDSALISAQVKYLPDLAYYLKAHPEIKKIHIYGYGLAENELQRLNQYELSFSASAKPSGIVASHWSPVLKSAMPLQVSGKYHNSSNSTVKLLLEGMGSGQDSVLIGAGREATFALKAYPKQSGQAVYHLIALQNKDTLSKEPVPFSVAPQQDLKVMVLAASPDFEYRFLKNWLFENQYKMMLRTRISKDKFSADFLNTAEISLASIQESTLKDVDLLIVDEEELNDLTANERALVAQQVAAGMGLIMRISDAKGSNRLINFERYEVPFNAAPLKLEAGQNIAGLPFSPTLYLKANAQDQPLLQDHEGRILVSSTISGMGVVVGSSLTGTYQWQLANEKASYANFWAMLFAHAAKKEQLKYSLELSPRFAVAGQQNRLIIDGVDEKVPEVKVNDIKLKWRQNMELPFEWDATFWPSKSGWQAFKLADETIPFYVYEPGDWQSLKQSELLAVNEQFKQVKQLDNSKLEESTHRREISKWWFFILFLLSASFLWFEQRVLSAV